MKRRSAEEFDRYIRRAIRNVSAEISGNARGSRIAAGLSTEGYAGGYRQALYDIQCLTVADVPLPTTRSYWEDHDHDHT